MNPAVVKGAATAADVRTYGNWLKPRQPGIGPLGPLGSATLLGGGAIVFLVLVALGPVLAGLLAVLILLALVPVAIRTDGRSAWTRLGARVAHRRNRPNAASAPTLLGAGVGEQAARLPGLLLPTKLIGITDALSRPAAIVSHPRPGQYTAVLECTPEAGSLVDTETLDDWVARWGEFLADLAHEPALVAAQVTVETAPDRGEKLAQEVDRLIQPGAPAFAVHVLDEARTTWPRGSATVRTWVSLTWARAIGAARPVPEDRLLAMIADRLPGLCQGLTAAGCGHVTPLAADAITRIVSDAYSPGDAGEVPIPWSEAGPHGMAVGWDRLRHDAGWSRTWRMVSAPRSAVHAKALGNLLAAKDGLTRKRVTLTYRPHSPAAAADIADRDVRTAKGKATERTHQSKATESLAWSMAEQTAAEQAAGAGLVRFSLLCTVTVGSAQELLSADHIVDQISASARVRLKPAYGSQAACFAAALGIGVILPSHVHVPAALREVL